jgi:crotonobetainyl-CoA:carnitine CoA-transferase CaiB-like acyl-CoA transferase
MEKVLEGIRVLDFGRFIAAPYCGMMLADMGAEVIRIDRPGGEEDRSVGLKASNGENMSYPSYARNKKAITLDLLNKDNAQAKEVLSDLVKKSDVVVQNFSPGAIRIFNLEYEDFKAMKEDIIYAGISCYGSDGPYHDRNGFDQIAQCFSGAVYLSGLEEHGPMRSGLPWVDYSTALCTTIGVLLALRHRDKTGEGQAVDCALLQTAMSFMGPMIAEAEVLGRERPQIGNRSAYFGPTDLYECKDGHVYIATTMEGMWVRLMKLIGHEELLDDPDCKTDMDRFENRDRIDPYVKEWMKKHTKDEVVAAMEENRIPCGIANRTSEVADDPHVKFRKMLEYTDLEEPGLNEVPICGMPVRLSKSPGSVETRAPKVGEHNQHFYVDVLGYSQEKIENLTAAGVI